VESRASRSVGKDIGYFFGAIEIDGFIDKNEFKKQIDEWIHGSLIPGDPEREAEAIRSKEGFQLLSSG
jgi:LDH2 family malate/lactate/ureidoglycolate dehydrogenase